MSDPGTGPATVQGAVQQLAWLLVAATAVGLLGSRIKVPYAVLLVVAALLAAQVPGLSVPHLDPSVVLFVFLPPLLFDASFRIHEHALRRVLRPTLLLAVIGTVLTALAVGGLVAAILRLPLPEALLFGSMVAATDPVAVVGVFRRLGAPPLLTVLLEGESLINDGVAITLYVVFLGLATGGSGPGGGVDVAGALGLFGREFFGGLLIGGVLGVLVSRIGSLVDDHLVEMTLSTALAYGSYLLAQSAGTSGALACVAAGLVHGSYGREIGMSDQTRRLLDDLWEYLGFLANALVFLLVGFSVDLGLLTSFAGPVVVAILVVVLSRFVLVQALGLPGRRASYQTSQSERMVLAWGGLRGALTVALALSLPVAVASSNELVALAFGVVLFTLVVQGTTLPWLLRATGLTQPASKNENAK